MVKTSRYEEVHVWDQEEEFETISKVWRIVEKFMMATMLVLLILCVVTERKKGIILKEEKEILFIMGSFVFQTPIAHIICFLISLFVYIPLLCLGKSEIAYKMFAFYTFLKYAIELLITKVCFVLGVRILIQGSLDDRTLHLVFFIVMIVFCLLILTVRVVWFCSKVGEGGRLTQKGDRTYIVTAEDHDKEDVRRLLDNVDEATSVKAGRRIDPIEGITM